MQNITQTAYVDQSRLVTEVRQETSELCGACFVGTSGDADEEPLACFANVAAIECARLANLTDLGVPLRQHDFYFFDLPGSTTCSWPRNHSAALRQDRRVFDER